MKTLATQKIKSISTALSNTEILQSVLKTVLCFAGGILSGIPYIFDSCAPLSVALPSSLGLVNSIACTFGAILGIFVFQSGLTAFQSFAQLITSVVILQIFVYYFGVNRRNLLRHLCPTFCAVCVNSIFLFSQRLSVETIALSIFETVLIPLCITLFSNSIPLINKSFSFEKLDGKQQICVLLSFNVLIGQLRYFESLGQALCVAVFFFEILFFYGKKMQSLCIACGCACCFAYALNDSVDFMCCTFPLTSALLFIFKEQKKPLASALCCVICFAGCVLGEYSQIFPTFIACVVACVVFLFLPDKHLQKNISSTLDYRPNPIAVPLQAKEISCAVEGLGNCINAVRKTLTPMTQASLKEILYRSTKRVCDKCEIKESCINSIRQKENEIYIRLEKAVCENRLSIYDFSDNFTEACYQSNEILLAIKQGYFLHCIDKNSQNKINKFQEITGNQFKAMGNILNNICTCAVNAGAVVLRDSPTGAACGEDIGLKIKSSGLCTNSVGQDYYTLCFEKPKENFNVTLLTKNLCKQTGTDLDFPTLIQKDDYYSLVFKQKERVGFKISAATKAASPQGISGDYYRSFCDKFSRQNIVLSDGMGTGSRAAVDSAFACETLCNLLKSGLDVKTSVSTVNCAMLMKSVDESLATIDLVIADPILSTVKIYKCGSAPTFILRQGKASVLEAESTPIGILENVDMASSEFPVEVGDIILTVSDGITGDNQNWILNEIKARKFDNPSALAKHILQCALDRKTPKYPDDMTVIALYVSTP